ncbi:MAG TPA: hypothetical protein VNL34_04125 [Candidatus Nitrosotenuis sp.]|nr:hypothetical protein [Candidatus Nitrosotenuis sp.]
MLAETTTIHQVPISKLQNSPIQVTLHSAKTIERIATIAKDPIQREWFAPIKIAILKDELFLVDGHAIVEGFKLAGIETVNAVMHQAESITEILALHLKSNQHSPLNPFRIIEMINFLLEDGQLPEQIVQKLQLGEHLTKLIGCRLLNQEAKNRLENFIHELSARYSNVVIPPYFAELVCKVPPKIQLEVVEQFIAIMDLTLPDRKFAFPGPETLEVYFRQYLKNKEREPIFFKEETQNKKQTKNSAKTICIDDLTPKEKEYANSIGTVPGMALLKVERPGWYRVNLVKKSITQIRDEGDFTVIEGEEGKKIFMLPQSAVEFLEISDESDASNVIVNNLTVNQLKKFAAKISSKKDRFVVIWSSVKF